LFPESTYVSLLPDLLILAGRKYYQNQVRQIMNGDVCFRTLLYNLPESCLLADEQVMEELSFAGEITPESKRAVQFTLKRAGTLNCFVDF
jgi:hypothetical protein